MDFNVSGLGESKMKAISPLVGGPKDGRDPWLALPDRAEGGAWRRATLPASSAFCSLAIAAETPADVAPREALLDRAMGPNRKRKSSEKLRRGRRPSEGLAFSAKDAEGSLVGTVRLWDVSVGDCRAPALLLGPLAVDPAAKSSGIGSTLMRHAIAEARRLGHGAILLVGDAPYYARFGFTTEKTDALAMPGPFEKSRFLALELIEGWLDGTRGVLKASGRRAKAGVERRRLAA